MPLFVLSSSVMMRRCYMMFGRFYILMMVRMLHISNIMNWPVFRNTTMIRLSIRFFVQP